MLEKEGPADTKRSKEIAKICHQLDERKQNREFRLRHARNSIIEFINKTALDTSVIDNNIRKRINEVVDRVYHQYEKKMSEWIE